jgi:hypothetical protein
MPYLGGWLPSSLANMGGRNSVAGLGLKNAIPGRLASIIAGKHGRKELRGRIRVKKCHTWKAGFHLRWQTWEEGTAWQD